MAARSMVFSNSRTLPSQGRLINSRSASGEMSSGRPRLRLFFSRKWLTRAGMSSTRSRSGARWM